MTTLSVVIPAYNAEQTIALVLDSVLSQSPDEVIVVDDGSEDQTEAILATRARTSSILHSVRLTRGHQTSRARVRNCGAAQARGEHILFLDSAWALTPGLLNEARSTLDGETVLLVPFDTQEFGRAFATQPGSLDPRWAYMEQWGGDLARLACPWLLGWTGALFVPRAKFEHIGGFDEEFVGWGAEDIELCLRLFDAGIRFRALLSHCARRLAPSRSEDDRSQQLQVNVERLHRKHCLLETELLNYMGQLYVGSFVERIEHLPMGYVLQEYEPEALSGILSALSSISPASSLLSGANPSLAARVPTTHLLAHNVASEMYMRHYFRGTNVNRLIGASLPFGDRTFGMAIMTDFIRALPLRIRAATLIELARISSSSMLILSIRETPYSRRIGRSAFREAAGWQLCSIEQLRQEAIALGLQWTPTYQSHYTVTVVFSRS